MSGQPLVTRWRLALRDSDLDPTAKHVGHVLATYMTGEGLTGHDAQHPAPSLLTLAGGVGFSIKYHDNTAVRAAIARLEAAGLLHVTRLRGRRQGFRYQALIPVQGPECSPRSSDRDAIPEHSGPSTSTSRSTAREHPGSGTGGTRSELDRELAEGFSGQEIPTPEERQRVLDLLHNYRVGRPLPDESQPLNEGVKREPDRPDRPDHGLGPESRADSPPPHPSEPEPGESEVPAERGYWECPCGSEPSKRGQTTTPVRTTVSLREPRCPFCGRSRSDAPVTEAAS